MDHVLLKEKKVVSSESPSGATQLQDHGMALPQGLLLVRENHKCPLTDMHLLSKMCLL